jgi:hypothetical protein
MSSQDQSIRLQVQLSQDDYAKYFAVVGKRQSDPVNFAIYIGAFFLAIPVALAARAIAAFETASPIAIEIAGRFSLFAFVAGLLTFVLALWIIRRRWIANTVSAIPNAYESKTVALDDNEVSITGKLSKMAWTWPAITHVSGEQGLVLFWIGAQNAVVIPDRAFADAAAKASVVAFARDRIARTQADREVK